MKKGFNTKKITIMGLLSAVAYISLLFIRIPLVPAASFLKFDISDIIVTFGGFLFGPLASFLIAFVVGFIQMITVSESGIIGMFMNVLSTVAFACPAAYLYNRFKTTKSAVIGLLIGCVAMTVAMLLFNYIATPIYMGISRDTVAAMLLPVFLPFNVLKSVLNAVGTLVLYKAVGKIIQNIM
jgi:riboflavin transporter FmnP